MKRMTGMLLAVVIATAWTTGCGSDDEKKSCVLGTTEGCEGGQVCESVAGGEPTCFAPLFVEGRVFDLTDDSGIVDATLVALDANGGARTTVARSGAGGAYRLPILVPRNSDGSPNAESVTLRVSALGYQTFPVAPRTALPIEVGSATLVDKAYVVKAATTDVGLVPLAGDISALSTIFGTVDRGSLTDLPTAGVLVVAELGGKAVATAVTDLDGDFVLFNVPKGTVTLGGYRAGINVTPLDVTVDGDVKDVKLVADGSNLTTVTGSVNIVNAPGGSVTSVLLVVESTFDEATKRGESPAGLRAGDVTGAFSIAGVSPGKYVVLAAFENDGLVRDPDQTIGGTAIVRITVSGGTQDTGESFKVTGALAVTSPGANSIEAISTAEPTFVWEDDSSEDGYELRVYNALGELVHENTAIAGVSGSATVSYTWTGAQLVPGMIYQFRVLSFRDKKGVTTYISATEDLRGVFVYEPGS